MVTGTQVRIPYTFHCGNVCNWPMLVLLVGVKRTLGTDTARCERRVVLYNSRKKRKQKNGRTTAI